VDLFRRFAVDCTEISNLLCAVPHRPRVGVRNKHSLGSATRRYGITKDQAELQIKAFEQMHTDYPPKSSA